MGYYTSYQLEFPNKNTQNLELYENIISHLRITKEWADFALDESGETNESCKWYDWKDDITEFSKLYPDVVFLLKGEGEESGDIWRAYFLNGKCEVQ